MSDLLFEIGSEELPPSAVRAGEAQLGAAVERALRDARLTHEGLETFATPRRLAVLVRGLPEAQASAVEERRGPAVKQGLMADGSFSPAAVGFARAAGVDAAQLVRKETAQGEYLFIVRELPGAATRDVLPAALASVLAELAFPKTMRWDASKVRFPRPIRWLVALFGEDVVPVACGELVASRATTGHRVFHPQTVDVPSAVAYEATVRAAGVIPRRLERRDVVRRQVEEAARGAGGRAVIHEDVLDEVTDLVEKPVAFVGRFETRYLKIPRDVLVTAMQAHQRYFPVEDEEGQLAAAFVVISNADPEAEKTIVAGNERVLRARLEDAQFFFNEDSKVSLWARTEQLGGVVLHAKLGSMRDKVLRVSSLLGSLVGWAGLAAEDADAAFAAADLYKADLVTHLVFEFPELQGAVGAELALRDAELRDSYGGLLPKVATAIREHYQPRFAGDDLPRSAAGIALSVADRLDTLVGYVGIGLTPSGSEDPYALRRAATGLASIVLDASVAFPVDDAIRAAHETFARQGVELRPVDEVLEDLRGLVIARAEGLLEREGVERMFVEAARRGPWTDLPDLARRARALQRLRAEGKLHGLAVAFERAYNLSKGEPRGEVDEAALEHEAEQNLYAQLVAVEEIARERVEARDYYGALETLVALSEVVDAFFDRERGVMVMVDDERLRRNRLALLARVAHVFALVADFSVVPPALLAEGATVAARGA